MLLGKKRKWKKERRRFALSTRHWGVPHLLSGRFGLKQMMLASGSWAGFRLPAWCALAFPGTGTTQPPLPFLIGPSLQGRCAKPHMVTGKKGQLLLLHARWPFLSPGAEVRHQGGGHSPILACGAAILAHLSAAACNSVTFSCCRVGGSGNATLKGHNYNFIKL